MSGMTPSRPEPTEETHRQHLALAEWLGLAPDEVAGMSWTTIETKPDRGSWTPMEALPEPEAVVEFSTPPGVEPNRWTWSTSSEGQLVRWQLVLPVADLVEVLTGP
jgi:hypothetical protein